MLLLAEPAPLLPAAAGARAVVGTKPERATCIARQAAAACSLAANLPRLCTCRTDTPFVQGMRFEGPEATFTCGSAADWTGCFQECVCTRDAHVANTSLPDCTFATFHPAHDRCGGQALCRHLVNTTAALADATATAGMVNGYWGAFDGERAALHPHQLPASNASECRQGDWCQCKDGAACAASAAAHRPPRCATRPLRCAPPTRAWCRGRGPAARGPVD